MEALWQALYCTLVYYSSAAVIGHFIATCINHFTIRRDDQ